MTDALIIDRYAVYGVIASGGMATVHYGRLVGQGGFSRTVAIKRLHPQFASDPALVAMMVDEARLVSRIRHPNVVPTLDVVASGSEVLVVMEYVAGEALSQLRKVSRLTEPIPVPIAAAIMADVLRGLQAAHDAKDEKGEPLGIVHRDVSPQNILVGTDGQARILDFGVAKAEGRSQTTVNGIIKGKIAYMSPEQIEGRAVTLQTDLFAAGIVLWELLTGHRLFLGDNAGEVALKVVTARIEPPSRVVPSRATAIAPYDAFFAQGLSRDPEARFSSARQMREALEACGPIAPGIVVADWLQNLAHDALSRRAKALSDIEGSKLAVIATPLEVVPVSVASSSVSPSIEDRPLPVRARRRVSLLWPLVAMLGATIVVLLFLRHAPSQAASTSVPIAAEQSAPLPPADPILPAAPPTTESAVPVEPAAPLHAGSSSPARPSPRAPRAATSLATAAVTAAGETSAPSSPNPPAVRDCVPYTWDAHGIKHYNPACL